MDTVAETSFSSHLYSPAPVVDRKLDRDIFSERRRRAPDVHRDIEDAPAPDPDQLVLGERRDLEMQAAQRADGGGKGMVVLDEDVVEPPPIQAAA